MELNLLEPSNAARPDLTDRAPSESSGLRTRSLLKPFACLGARRENALRVRCAIG